MCAGHPTTAFFYNAHLGSLCSICCLCCCEWPCRSLPGSVAPRHAGIEFMHHSCERGHRKVDSIPGCWLGRTDQAAKETGIITFTQGLRLPACPAVGTSAYWEGRPGVRGQREKGGEGQRAEAVVPCSDFMTTTSSACSGAGAVAESSTPESSRPTFSELKCQPGFAAKALQVAPAVCGSATPA